MDNNQDEDDLGKYIKDFERLQDCCLVLKKIEENIIFQYKYLNYGYNNQEYFQQSYLIEMKEYNKFKEQIEYNIFINDIKSYKEAIIIKLVIQESENKNDITEKLKQTVVSSAEKLYKLLKEGNEYIIINIDLIQNLIENKDLGIYSYSLNKNETILNIKGENLHFKNNKNILNLKVLKTKEHEKFPKIDEQEKLIDWLQKFINTEQDFKNQLKSIKKVTENKENYGYLINYNTYKNWENNLKLNSLRSIIEQYKTEEKKLLTKDEKQ